MTIQNHLITMASNKDIFNTTGDTRMVYCNLSEVCSKNKLKYSQFIEALQWEVIENKKLSFKLVDFEVQKIIIGKLLEALNKPDESYAQIVTEDLTLSFAKYLRTYESSSDAEENQIINSMKNLKDYANECVKLLIAEYIDNIDEAMDIIRDEYVAERFKDDEPRWDYDSSDRMAVRI